MSDEFNLFRHDRFYCSPIEYVRRGLNLAAASQRESLAQLLESYDCRPVYYAVTGDQPEDVIGEPPHITRILREQQARRAKQAQEEEDLQIQLLKAQKIFEHRVSLLKEEAATEQEISDTRHRLRLEQEKENAEAQDANLKKSRELSMALAAGAAKQNAIETEHRWKAELEHQRLLGQTNLEVARLINEQILEQSRKVQEGERHHEREMTKQRQISMDAQFAAESHHQEQSNRRYKERAAIEESATSAQRKLIQDQTTLAREAQKVGLASPAGRNALGWHSTLSLS